MAVAAIGESRPDWLSLTLSKRHGFTRQVSVSSSALGVSRYVAKIETCWMRQDRSGVTFALAEEIAYKICKLFHWNTVPKTKVLHQLSEQSEKYEWYFHWMSPFIESNPGLVEAKAPMTFTFQTYVEGRDLSNRKESETLKPNLSAFQKAYLLQMIMSNSDCRRDNMILNSETGELFLVDNEYIGCPVNCYGSLKDFSALEEEPISAEIIKEFMQASASQLKIVQSKYEPRERSIRSLWMGEAFPRGHLDPSKVYAEAWDRLIARFQTLQTILHALSQEGTVATMR